jgi:hypothetical protein
MSKTIFCVASTEFQAESILNELRVAGFKDDAFSILLADKTRAVVRGVTGSVTTDSAVGWLPQVQSLTISGAGAYIASGVLAASLNEAAAGSHKGAIPRALTGMGLESGQADMYDDRLRSGRVLMAVDTRDDEQAHIAQTVFDHAGAEQITVTGEPASVATAPKLREEKWEQW